MYLQRNKCLKINFILIGSSTYIGRRNKMCTVEPIRSKKDIKKVEKILEAQSKRNLLLFVMGINFGLRITDILSLNVGDVKDKNFIELYEKKTGKYKKIPVNSRLKPMFDEYTKGRKINEPLFLSYRNKRLDRITSYNIIKEACRLAGLEEVVGTHTMRKTFGYHHYKKYNDVALLQKIFNHSSLAITLRYIGIDQEEIYFSYSNFIL